MIEICIIKQVFNQGEPFHKHPLRTTRVHARLTWRKSYAFLKKINFSFHSLELCVTLANLIFSTKPIMMHIWMQEIKKFNSSLKYHLLGSNCQTEQCTEYPFHLYLNSDLQNAFISLLISYYLLYCIHRWRSCFKERLWTTI